MHTTRARHVDIELLPAAAARDGDLVGEITGLVNRVYTVAEEGLWLARVTRTTTTDMAEMIGAWQIAVARIDRHIVGAVRIQQLDATKGEFGMLVADPARRGEGVGRELVTFAEQLTRQRGLAVMQLELLVPREWTHPNKEMLHAWYTRMGYRPVRSGTIDESYPTLAPLLSTPCDFVIYHKDLEAQPRQRSPHPR